MAMKRRSRPTVGVPSHKPGQKSGDKAKNRSKAHGGAAKAARGSATVKPSKSKSATTAKRSAVKKPKPASAKPPIPQEQWSLPVSVGPDGHLVTLKQMASERTAALSFGQLSPNQQSELVAARIEKQPKFELAMIGAGVVSKERAVQEVRARSPVGRTLIEIEQLMISHMIERATQTA